MSISTARSQLRSGVVMNRFFAPCYCHDNLTIKEWIVYVYLFGVAYYKDSDNGKIKRGQALFGLRDLDQVMPKTTAARCRDSLAEKGLIIVDKFTKYPNSKNIITLCKYDEINKKSGTLWDALAGHKRDSLDTRIITISDEIENQWDVDNFLSGNAIDLSDLTSFTNVKDIVDDTTPTPPKKRTSKPKVPAPTAPLREAYKRHIMERYGIEPTFAAKENKLVCDILAYFKHDQEKSVAAIGHFFEIKDKFFLDSRHSLTVLRSNLQKIEISLKEKTGYMAAITEDYFGN